MRVIDRPDVSNWKFLHTCDNCECQLEVESKDLRHTHISGYYNEPSYEQFSAICSVCNQSFNIPNKDIPRLIQLEAMDRAKQLSTDAMDYYNK